MSSIPGLWRSPREGNGNPLQYSCLENPMDREAWWATVHGVAKSQMWLKWLSTEQGSWCVTQELSLKLCDDPEGRDGGLKWEGGSRQRGDIYVCVYVCTYWLIHVAWPKPTQYCKTTNLQLKINFKKGKIRYHLLNTILEKKHCCYTNMFDWLVNDYRLQESHFGQLLHYTACHPWHRHSEPWMVYLYSHKQCDGRWIFVSTTCYIWISICIWRMIL